MDGFEEGVVYEDVLFFSLHQKVALRADLAQKTAHTQLTLALDLLQHRVQNNVRACRRGNGQTCQIKLFNKPSNEIAKILATSSRCQSSRPRSVRRQSQLLDDYFDIKLAHVNSPRYGHDDGPGEQPCQQDAIYYPWPWEKGRENGLCQPPELCPRTVMES